MLGVLGICKRGCKRVNFNKNNESPGQGFFLLLYLRGPSNRRETHLTRNSDGDVSSTRIT